jgi:hypothetical protein
MSFGGTGCGRMLGWDRSTGTRLHDRQAEEADVVEKMPKDRVVSAPSRPPDSGLRQQPGRSRSGRSAVVLGHERRQDARRSGPSDPPDRP